MQPGNPGQDPYNQQPHQDPTAPQYSDPYAQPPQAPYGQQSHDPYAQPPQAPYGQQPTSGQPYGQPTSGQPYGQPTSGQPYGQQPQYGDPYAQQQPYGAAPGYPGQYGQAQGQDNKLGLIGMISGITSIVLALCCPLLGVPAGIAGVVLGVMGQKKADQGTATNRGQAKAALITGGVGIVLSIISAIAGAAINMNNFGS